MTKDVYEVEDYSEYLGWDSLSGELESLKEAKEIAKEFYNKGYTTRIIRTRTTKSIIEVNRVEKERKNEA